MTKKRTEVQDTLISNEEKDQIRRYST